jgi:hypothetical protein
VNNFVGEYCLNWGLTEAVIRDLVQQSLYEFLFINQNCSDIKGKHCDADTVMPVALKHLYTHFSLMFL